MRFSVCLLLNTNIDADSVHLDLTAPNGSLNCIYTVCYRGFKIVQQTAKPYNFCNRRLKGYCIDFRGMPAHLRGSKSLIEETAEPRPDMIS